ncbi:MAG: hypothetical protein LBH92_06085 [Bacteroidales bacterium]|nr:hypothetical protein [Bacteroidales bacterium]
MIEVSPFFVNFELSIGDLKGDLLSSLDNRNTLQATQTEFPAHFFYGASVNAIQNMYLSQSALFSHRT